MKKYIICLLLTVALFSCDKEDDLGPSRIKQDVQERIGLDKKIYEHFTLPYNMEVKYKWDGNELDFSRLLIPPTTESAEFFLDAIESAWIKPYKNSAGENFIKTYCPKLLVLVGGANINSNGTTTEIGRASCRERVYAPV